MFKTLQIFDNFYANPAHVRAIALAQGLWHQKKEDGLAYELESQKSFHTPAVAARFESLAGSPIHVDPARMGFGVFALTYETSNSDLTTHFDDTDWAAIVFLAPGCLGEAGISLYRHRESGLFGPPTDDEAHRLGFENKEGWLREVYYRDKLRPDAWEETTRIVSRFNRMVLLKGSRVFHRAHAGFGDSPTTGRLTQRFFFNDRG